MPAQADDLLESSKKAVRWLRALGDKNLAAARAWQLCKQLLEEAATKIGRKVDGMADQPPRLTAPSRDSASMSTGTARQQQSYGRSHGQEPGRGSDYSASSNIHVSGTTTAEVVWFHLPAHAAFGPLMHFDPYFPSTTGVDPRPMQFAQDLSTEQY